MDSVRYTWAGGEEGGALELALVNGTHGQPYLFGEGDCRLPVELRDFHMATVPVTQAFWTHIAGARANPSLNQGLELPLENVSWNELTQAGGFLERLNRSPARTWVSATLGASAGVFRLPSETEWEYAARGGPHWGDNYRFSGSDDIATVAWYDRRHGDHTQPVGRKAPNQLGLLDMSGNVWEWCQDVFTAQAADVPQDGTAFRGPGTERVLRGGCFHNWAAHCTVSKRYQIAPDFHDGCIGFRLVFATHG